MRIIDPHPHLDRMRGKNAETLSIAGVEAGILPTPPLLIELAGFQFVLGLAIIRKTL